MDKIIKNKKRILLLLVFLFIIYYLLFIIPLSAIAQIKLETGLPGIPGNELPAGAELPNYIRYLFLFGLSLITIVALGQMIIGGIMYILAAGNAAKVEDAKDTIFQALFGLGILLVSYLLLRTINPDLVNLRNPSLAPIQFQGGGGSSGGVVTPTGPDVPPISGTPSVLIYNVTSPQACAGAGGKAFSPCQTYCLATPGLCSAGTVCCGTQP